MNLLKELSKEEKWRLWLEICGVQSESLPCGTVKDFVEKGYFLKTEQPIVGVTTAGIVTSVFDFLYKRVVYIEHCGVNVKVEFDFSGKIFPDVVYKQRQRGCECHRMEQLEWEEGGGGTWTGSPRTMKICRTCFKTESHKFRNILRSIFQKPY